MYEYQINSQFFAQAAEDIKELAVQELSELGARTINPGYGGIYFSADKETLYRINYTTRLASRILAPLASFRCLSTDQLYAKALQVQWQDIISLENTFAVFCNVSNSPIRNSHYAALRLKDGVVDAFRKISGKRPDIDSRSPDIWLNLYIRTDRAVISLDTSGGSLHRRGYRKDSLSAPMQENVAAAIIRYTQWNGSVPLHDPMCGSGTLLCEALMQYCNIPAGALRGRFGFEFLPDYDSSLWLKVKNECDRRIRELPDGYISGSDTSAKAVAMTRRNARKLKYGDTIRLQKIDFRKSSGFKNGVIVTNPPYGIRMGDRKELDLLCKSLGDFLKQKCRGSTAYIYFGERELIKKIGLRTSWKKPLKSGGLDGRLVKYELF